MVRFVIMNFNVYFVKYSRHVVRISNSKGISVHDFNYETQKLPLQRFAKFLHKKKNHIKIENCAKFTKLSSHSASHIQCQGYQKSQIDCSFGTDKCLIQSFTKQLFPLWKVFAKKHFSARTPWVLNHISIISPNQMLTKEKGFPFSLKIMLCLKRIKNSWQIF